MTPINTELFAFAVRRAEEGLENEPDAFAADLDIIEALLDRCEIRVLPEDRFFVRIDVENIPQKIIQLRRKRCASLRAENGLQEGFDARAHTGSNDFGHTSADWDAVIRLGIFGLRERAASCAARFTGEEKRRAFYAGLCRTYDAALRFMARAAAEAKRRGKDEMAAGLARLCSARPSTLFEAMQTSVVYYTLQQFFDGSVLRTLGRVDSLFYPFCEGEDPAFIEALTADYLEEIDRFRATANLPFALGGRDAAGRSLVNPLSYRFLRAYRSARTTSVKLHLLCAECTPEPFLAEALDAVRSGRNSIVFLSDEKIVEALIRLDEDPADAADYRVVGCYECGGRDEVTCSCGTRVSIPKALEYALNGGVDSVTGKNVGLPSAGPIGSFEDFWKEFERQLVRLCEEAMRETDLWEERDAAFHSAPILSATYESALEKGGDLYCDHSAKYANSSLNAVGLATAADSLAAVRRLVFEEKRFTLDGLAALLRRDWEGAETLRLRVKNKFPKFGTGEEETDRLAAGIVNVLDAAVNGKPNKKGGVYRLGLFSVDWRWKFGEMCGASADGRRAHEPLSQNTGASPGAAREGATAHLASVARLNAAAVPNGAIADIDLHTSAVTGENGLGALLASLRTYFSLGGFAVHFNVLDLNVLREAKEHPDRYPDLQVRLCGWNVLFSSLSEKEKEEFILRSASV